MASAERVTALAEAVADGRPLDWGSAEQSASTPDERAAVAVFRDLAIVGGLFASASATRLAAPCRSRPRLSAGASWGSLQIKAHVGRGRFGDVYRARDAALDRDVALKLIDDDRHASSSGSDVIAEGRLMARVRHPNVVAIHGAQRIDDVTSLTMEFVEGRTLEEELAARGHFSAEELTSAGLQMCEALAAVHGAGLVHRDVKASNILRDRSSGRVMLGDFGTGHELEETGLPAEGLVGTPAYLAPEVFAGRGATAQSDLYSLGVLLFRLATGDYPFRERSILALRAAHGRKARASIREREARLPEPLVAIIDRALDPDPSQRFGSAEAMGQALRRCQQLPARRRALLSAVAGTALLVALIVGLGRALRTTPPLHFSERDAVLVTKFENRTGESILDSAVEYALELDLADSGVAIVASRERVVETLALMSREPDTVVDWPIGREIALRDGRIRIVVAGQVDRLGQVYRISARLLEPESGAAVGSVVEIASSIDDLMGTIGRIARGVRQRLGEALPALPAPGAELPRVRTRSFSALRKYAGALPDLYRDANPKLARQLLEDATREDPQFALAHLALARAIQQGRDGDRSAAIDSAILANLDRASDLVRSTSGVDAHIVAAEAENLRSILAREPHRVEDRRAHWERALQAAQMWQRLQPTSERAIYLQTELHRAMRLPPSADLAIVRRLVELRPNGLDALHRAANRLALSGEIAEAREYMARARPLLDQPISGRSGRQLALMGRWGQFDDAWIRNDMAEAREWARQIDAMRAEEVNPTYEFSEAGIWCHVALGQLDRAETIAMQIREEVPRAVLSVAVAKRRGGARRMVEMATKLFPDRSVLRDDRYWGIRPELAWSAGDFAAARRELDALRHRGNVAKMTLDVMEGELALAEGHPKRTIAIFQPLVAAHQGRLVNDAWLDRSVVLADAFAAAGHRDDAIRVLEAVSLRKREILHPSTRFAHEWLTARDRLAQLYREAGRESEAVPIEGELRILLAAADADHPIARRLASVGKAPTPLLTRLAVSRR